MFILIFYRALYSIVLDISALAYYLIIDILRLLLILYNS